MSAYLHTHGDMNWETTLGWITEIGNLSTCIKRLIAPTPSVSVVAVCKTNKSQRCELFSADYRNLTMHFRGVSRRFKSRYMLCSWWRHQMEIFSALLALCAGNRPVTRNFDIFFDLRLNKQLSKQSWGWWFETLSCPLWRPRNVKRVLE